MLSDEEIYKVLGLDGYDSMAVGNARVIEAAVLEKLKQQEHIYTDNKQTLVNALNRIDELESQNKALAGAAKLTIAWYEAEDDHSKADFYERLEMCRASESALRAAIAAAEGK